MWALTDYANYDLKTINITDESMHAIDQFKTCKHAVCRSM